MFFLFQERLLILNRTNCRKLCDMYGVNAMKELEHIKKGRQNS